MYLDETQYYEFPPVTLSTSEGIVATGGNLSPGMLVSAYSQGIFPWYSDFEPILWWSPDPRFVLHFENLIITSSMRKIMKQDLFSLTFDTCFDRVIDSCKFIKREGQDGTWITNEMRGAYLRFHELGYAHSLEVWHGDELVGGLYGVSLGRCFFGESMFTSVSNASKTAFIYLAKTLEDDGFHFIDSQVCNPHVSSLGAVNIPREIYMKQLKDGLGSHTIRGKWTDRFPIRKTSEILKL